VGSWEEDAYVILPAFLDASEVARLATLSETVVDN